MFSMARQSSDDLVFQSNSEPGRSCQPTLRNAYVHVTKACNLRCEYCYFSAAAPLRDELSRKEFAALWADLVALGVRRVIVTGGEPFLRPDIADLLVDLHAADPNRTVVRCLNTNGYFITPAVAASLVGLVDEVRVSIDGLRATHDYLRGPGSFGAAISALRYFYEVGFEPKALVTVTSTSLPDLEELIGCLLANKITRIKLNVFREIGRGYGKRHLRPDEAGLRAALCKVAERLGRDPENHHEHAEGFTDSGCGVGQHVNIMPNGDVFPCHALVSPSFRCGNIRHIALAKMLGHGALLPRLAAVTRSSLAQWQDLRVTEAAAQHGCLAVIHSQSRGSAVWDSVIKQPLVQIQRA